LQQVGAAIQEGEFRQAESQLRAALAQYPRDPRALEMLGVVLDGEKKYAEAGIYYHKALQLDPHSVSILNNLANHDLAVGKVAEAQVLFLRVLAHSPHQVNACVQLARMSIAAHDGAAALRYLSVLPPTVSENPGIEILRAEALHGSRQPKQAEALLAAMVHSAPQDPRIAFSAGMADVSWRNYAKAEEWLTLAFHDDPSSYDILYNLGLAAVKAGDTASAEQALNAALARRPDDADVLYSLAWIEQKNGEFAQAAAHLVKARRLAPRRPDILLLLGQVSEKLGFYGDAADALRQSLQSRPEDPVIRREYGYALAHTAESREGVEILSQYVAKNPRDARGYYELGVAESVQVPAKAVLDLKQALRLDPSLTEAQEGLGETLAREGKLAGSLTEFDKILTAHPAVADLKACAESLLAAGQYNEAIKFFAAIPQAALLSRPEIIVDFAIATFHAKGSQAALAQLDSTPAASREGDYYLLRAQILDAMGQPQQAAQDLTLGLRANPSRPDLYFQAALFLLEHGQQNELLALLRQATRKFPHSRQLLLTQAIVYGLMRRFDEADSTLNRIEAEWPKWNEAYFIHGVIEVGRAQMGKAKQLLETAVALGNREPLAYYNLALSDMETYPVNLAEARRAIQKALVLGPNDPYVQSLAGKIAFEDKNYNEALGHLKAALALWPDMIEARQTLSRTYRALGQDQKAAAQLKEVARIMQKVQATDQAPPMDLKRFLFSVPGPKARNSL
jgi:tetratricopeptide (TPR) repeat protein